MKKILYITNISGAKMTGSFSGTAVRAAKSLGLEYHSIANRSAATLEQTALDEARFGIRLHHADIERSPFSLGNLKAYRQIVSLIRRESIDCIHCNTPVGGLLGRLAGRRCGVKKIIYQAHGFHFYTGAPKRNWLVYYPIEKFLCRYTDALITINSEDYRLARSPKGLNMGDNAYRVSGVGIDLKEFAGLERFRAEKRAELGLSDTDIMVISAGDLIRRKNYALAIRAIAMAKDSNLKYLICGKGPLLDKLQTLAKELGVQDRVRFLGHRTDMRQLLAAADIFLLSSVQEGLPRSLMEAMAMGLPCVATDIRGNTDLLPDGKGGYVLRADSPESWAAALEQLAGDRELRQRMGSENLQTIRSCDVSVVEQELKTIYAEVLGL